MMLYSILGGMMEHSGPKPGLLFVRSSPDAHMGFPQGSPVSSRNVQYIWIFFAVGPGVE